MRGSDPWQHAKNAKAKCFSMGKHAINVMTLALGMEQYPLLPMVQKEKLVRLNGQRRYGPKWFLKN